MQSMVEGALTLKQASRPTPLPPPFGRSPLPAFAGRDEVEGGVARAQSSACQSSTWLTMPSASLGSNQVDFGGMTAPASATAMRSRICVG